MPRSRATVRRSASTWVCRAATRCCASCRSERRLKFWITLTNANTTAAAAAVVFALVSVIQNFSLRSDLHEAQQRVAALQTHVDADRRTVARDRGMLTDLSASDAKRYTVAYGTVVTRGAHVYLALTSLPPLTRGKVYQAWTLARGAKTVAPSVVFTPSENGLTLVPLRADARSLAAVAVSVEPEGGSRQPTTKPTFVQPLGAA